MHVLSIYELIKINQYYIAIKRTPHFGVWSALASAVNSRGVWITAPALTPTLGWPNCHFLSDF